MASTKKKLEVYTVTFITEEGSDLTFEKVLLSKTIENFVAFINKKDVSVSILEKGDIIVGIVETSRRDNVPPKKHKKAKKISKLGLTDDEGLAYGNVFLYEKERKILFYEVNKFGSYINHFLNCLIQCCGEDEKWEERFNVEVRPILQPEEYTRMMKMNYYKSLEVKFSNPNALIKEFEHKNNALAKTVELTQQLGTETFNGKFEVRSKKQGGSGLSSVTIRDIVDKAQALLSSKSGQENLQKLVVYGYAVDEDDLAERLEPIDLLADRYIKYFTLNEPRENIDLLQPQRRKKIKEVYAKSLEDFELMFGK
ncbi:MAG: hypothetical protein Q8R82_11960 [Hyphomonadaceae bacterium]|nr:hypothetical protein [Hyphomonadaceae bacterium]